MKLFLATSNLHKVKEMKEILADMEVEILSPADFNELPIVKEDAEDFKENALKKAKVMSEYVDLPSIADDSGLVVEALDGRPGVYSARFAGEDATDKENNNKLLKLMEGIEEKNRRAYFACAMAFVTPVDYQEVVTGKCRGKIIDSPRGEQGFGYDPLFAPWGYERTFAELGEEIKNKISHRAEALRKMKKVLREYKT